MGVFRLRIETYKSSNWLPKRISVTSCVVDLLTSRDSSAQGCVLIGNHFNLHSVSAGNDTYCITCEYLIREDDRMFFAVPADFAHEATKAFLIKV